jgi:hypothetical protein
MKDSAVNLGIILREANARRGWGISAGANFHVPTFAVPAHLD